MTWQGISFLHWKTLFFQDSRNTTIIILGIQGCESSWWGGLSSSHHISAQCTGSTASRLLTLHSIVKSIKGGWFPAFQVQPKSMMFIPEPVLIFNTLIHCHCSPWSISAYLSQMFSGCGGSIRKPQFHSQSHLLHTPVTAPGGRCWRSTI